MHLINPDKYSLKKKLRPIVMNHRLLVVLLLLLTVPLTFYMIGQQTRTRQDAALTDTFITPGVMNLTATFDSIGVEILFDGDANKNSKAELEFKKKTETTWRKGLDLWGTYSTTAPGPAYYGSALLLDAGTEYDVKVTISDPDGGGTTLTKAISTRADTLPAASTLPATHFVRADGNDANIGTSDSPTGAWKTLNKAVQAAPSGAVVQVGPGSYDGLTVGRSTPITLRAQFPAVDDNQNIINAGKHSVVEPQVFSSPGQGVWQQVTLTGPHTKQPYTVWKWDNVPKWPSDIFHLTVAASRDEQPERVAYWFPLQKNVISGGTPNQYTLSTPEGWAEMVHVNKRYNYGFSSFGNDIYLMLPGNRNPNSLFVWVQPSVEKDWSPKFIFGSTDSRISGFRFVKIGPKLVSNSQRMTIDHNLFYDSGIVVEGVQPGTYGSDHVVEHNRFTATSLVHPTGTVENGIPWDFIKGSVWTPDNQAFFNRVGQGEEFSQIFFRGGAKRMVIRRNIFEGAFNGIGVYNFSYDRYGSSDTDVYENTFQNLADDAIEPEFNVSNWRIWNNKMMTVPVAVSTGPSNFGPLYFFKNIAWNLGASAAIKDVMGQRGIDSGLGFKYSSASNPPARIYVINNTFWSNHANAEGGAPYAGGPNSPENFYLRNNIFRMTRYAFLPSGMTKPGWDENFNHFYTSDPARGIASFLTIAQYRSASGQGANTNTAGDLHVNPDSWFINAASGDIRLTTTSPLTNAGTPIPNIYDNYNAKSSYSGSAPDIGASETQSTTPPPSTSFIFTAAGDFGDGTGINPAGTYLGRQVGSSLTFQGMAASGAAFNFALGDFTYTGAPTVQEKAQNWCNFVKSVTPPGFPLLLEVGDNDGPGGSVTHYTSCLPDPIGVSTMPGEAYPAEYFFDYPKTNPFARFIMLPSGYNTWTNGWHHYYKGTTHYSNLVKMIDEARAKGVTWIFVGTHEPALTVGAKPITLIHQDLFDLLLEKKVDVYMSAHEHNYQRTHQLSLNPTLCSSFPRTSTTANMNCVSDKDNSFTKGNGLIYMIIGTGGRTSSTGSFYEVNQAHGHFPYFSKVMGADRNAADDVNGFGKFTVSKDKIAYEFVPNFQDGQRLTDSFVINATPTTSTPTPTTTPSTGGTTTPATKLSLSPATSSKTAGQTFTTNVLIDTQNTVTNADLSLSFNPAVLEVTNVTLGSFLPGAQEVKKTIDNINGKLLYSFYTEGINAKTGTGTLATITWKAKAAGTSTVTLDQATTIVFGQGGGNVVESRTPATYSVTGTISPTATPTQPISSATATHTPTSTTIPSCALSNASWNLSSVDEGTMVTLRANVTGSGCAGKQVTFKVRENDSVIEGGLDEDAAIQPAVATVIGTTATSTWLAEWQNDCNGLCNNPEYYFNASIAGGNTLRSADPMLSVQKTETSVTLKLTLPYITSTQELLNSTVTIRSAAGVTTDKTVTLVPGTNNVYTGTLQTVLSQGSYSMLVKRHQFLAKKFNFTVGTTAPNLDFSGTPLVGGDINNDNVINTLDLGKVIEEYSPQNDTTAISDLTRDKRINALDLGIIIENYFRQGDSL